MRVSRVVLSMRYDMVRRLRYDTAGNRYIYGWS